MTKSWIGQVGVRTAVLVGACVVVLVCVWLVSARGRERVRKPAADVRRDRPAQLVSTDQGQTEGKTTEERGKEPALEKDKGKGRERAGKERGKGKREREREREGEREREPN